LLKHGIPPPCLRRISLAEDHAIPPRIRRRVARVCSAPSRFHRLDCAAVTMQEYARGTCEGPIPINGSSGLVTNAGGTQITEFPARRDSIVYNEVPSECVSATHSQEECDLPQVIRGKSAWVCCTTSTAPITGLLLDS